MAHLAHKLPWNTLASRLEFVRDRKDLTPRYTDLFIKPNSEDQLTYFLETLGDAIREFATTERKKYAANMTTSDKGSLFPPTAWQSALPYMKNQNLLRHSFNPINLHDAERIENWIANVGEILEGYDNPWNEAVSFMLSEGYMEPLFKLARHPKIRLDRLARTTGNYQYNYTETISDTLQAYVCFNLIFCKPELWSEGKKDHKNVRSFDTILRHLQSDIAGDLIYLHQRKYVGYPSSSDFDPFDDLDKLRNYLKECFRLFVRYEMMEREAGRAPDWIEIYGWSMEPYSMHKTSLYNIGNELVRTRQGKP